MPSFHIARGEQKQQQPQPHTTSVPNHLFDVVLPTLKDTEIRVLFVVVRATSGWLDPITGRRKKRDWISSAQMRKRTGRSSEAVSGAIDGLVQRGLLRVEDAAGNFLSTSAERRRHLGKLYFRLVELSLQPADQSVQGDVDMWKTHGVRRPVKPKTTKNKNIK